MILFHFLKSYHILGFLRLSASEFVNLLRNEPNRKPMRDVPSLPCGAEANLKIESKFDFSNSSALPNNMQCPATSTHFFGELWHWREFGWALQTMIYSHAYGRTCPSCGSPARIVLLLLQRLFPPCESSWPFRHFQVTMCYITLKSLREVQYGCHGFLSLRWELIFSTISGSSDAEMSS